MQAAESTVTQQTHASEDAAPAAPSDSPPHGIRARLKHGALEALRRVTEKRRQIQIEQLRAGREKVISKLREIPDRMQKLANQMRLLLDLVDDYWQGRYRHVPWYSMGVAVLAALYFLSPNDLVPDYLPIVGQLDDVAAIAIALRVLRQDLRKYCEFRRLNPADYF